MMGRVYEFADVLRHHARKQHLTADHALGRRGEDIAQRYLQRQGFIIVARNYRMASGAGEIDLVGWEDSQLVFIEVKSRRTDEYSAPDRAIGPQKQSSLIRAGREFARHANVLWENVRFDVVNILFTSPPSITHFRDVFGSPAA